MDINLQLLLQIINLKNRIKVHPTSPEALANRNAY